MCKGQIIVDYKCYTIHRKSYIIHIFDRLLVNLIIYKKGQERNLTFELFFVGIVINFTSVGF